VTTGPRGDIADSYYGGEIFPKEAKHMSKALIAVAVVGGAVVLAKRHALSGRGFDIEKFVERMPDGAPPKWAYDNITAIRENTDRILELLDTQQQAETPVKHRRAPTKKPGEQKDSA
jgi:hypothetical protein